MSTARTGRTGTMRVRCLQALFFFRWGCGQLPHLDNTSHFGHSRHSLPLNKIAEEPIL